MSSDSCRLPPWLRAGASPLSPETEKVREVLRRRSLHTVCQGAACPNLGRCFAEGVAAFMILGRRCARDCRFCAVEHGEPEPVDPGEPERLAQAVQDLRLKHIVITAVTRDDLPDGGAGQFAAAVRAVRSACPGSTIEVLTPDFGGNFQAVAMVVKARPDVYNHNVETVPRLYPEVRPQAHYQRSLDLLAAIKELDRGILTKSGLMAGLGETDAEVRGVLRDLRAAGCEMVTIGQYLRPTRNHLPVAEYVPPERFAAWDGEARSMGFKHVAAGPLVRSSFHAGEAMY